MRLIGPKIFHPSYRDEQNNAENTLTAINTHIIYSINEELSLLEYRFYSC